MSRLRDDVDTEQPRAAGDPVIHAPAHAWPGRAVRGADPLYRRLGGGDRKSGALPKASQEHGPHEAPTASCAPAQPISLRSRTEAFRCAFVVSRLRAEVPSGPFPAGLAVSPAITQLSRTGRDPPGLRRLSPTCRFRARPGVDGRPWTISTICAMWCPRRAAIHLCQLYRSGHELDGKAKIRTLPGQTSRKCRPLHNRRSSRARERRTTSGRRTCWQASGTLKEASVLVRDVEGRIDAGQRRPVDNFRTCVVPRLSARRASATSRPRATA